MRILGIDYGSKRVGIAVSDEAGKFALPVSVVANTPGLLGEVERIADRQGTKEVVLGESLNYTGGPNAILADSLGFKKVLEGKGFVVHLEPEFMTSIAAERFQGKNDLHDASAAALILQSFLDKKQTRSNE